MISGWKCDAWKQKINQAKQDLHDKKMTAGQVAQVEEEVIDELYQTIRKDITYDNNYEYYDLPKVIKDKKANCLGMSQLFYIIGSAIGLNVKVLDVLEQANSPLPKERGHVACLVILTDGKNIMADLALFFISEPFIFKDEYSDAGNYYQLIDKNNRLEIHRRIQIWDKNEILASICLERAYICSKSGKNVVAISYYNKAIGLNPKAAMIYAARGSVYEALGNTNEAISDYSKTIELNPINSIAYYYRGFAYYNLGQYTKAITDYNKAIDLDPEYAEAYVSVEMHMVNWANEKKVCLTSSKLLKLIQSLQRHI